MKNTPEQIKAKRRNFGQRLKLPSHDDVKANIHERKQASNEAFKRPQVKP